MDDREFPVDKDLGAEGDPVDVGAEAPGSSSEHGLVESTASGDLAKNSPIPTFKGEVVADIQGVEAVRPPPGTSEDHGAISVRKNFKGLDALFGPSTKIAEQHAALMAKMNFKGLDALLGPSTKFAEQHAALTANINFKGLDDLLGPSTKFAEQHAALMAKMNLKGLDALLGPSTKLAEQFAAITAGSKVKGLEALVKPSKQMVTLFESLKPLPSMKGMEALFGFGDGVAAGIVKGGSLTAAMMGSIASIPSMISLGASLATFGATSAAHHFNWDSIEPPSLLEAVGAAAQIIEEDRQANRSLSDLINQLNLAANSGVANKAELPETAVTKELSTAAQSGDVGHLSDGAKTYLSMLFWIISTLCAYLALQNGVREELCFLQPKILPSMTAGQIGKSIRAAACDLPLEMLKDYRFVRGESVRLRASPSAKANTIPIVLSDGDLLEVLSTENRDWLYVRVVRQEGVEGWISRRYAKQIIH